MGSLEVSEDKLVKGKSVQVVFSTIDTLTNEIDSPIHKLQQVTHFKRVSVLTNITVVYTCTLLYTNFIIHVFIYIIMLHVHVYSHNDKVTTVLSYYIFIIQ